MGICFVVSGCWSRICFFEFLVFYIFLCLFCVLHDIFFNDVKFSRQIPGNILFNIEICQIILYKYIKKKNKGKYFELRVWIWFFWLLFFFLERLSLEINLSWSFEIFMGLVWVVFGLCLYCYFYFGLEGDVVSYIHLQVLIILFMLIFWGGILNIKKYFFFGIVMVVYEEKLIN